MQGASLTLVRELRASPERVFAACTDPATMMRWLGPKEWRATEVETDVRVGGRFFFRMSGPEGVMAADGVYEIVDPPRKLVHSWRWIEGDNDDANPAVQSRVTYEIEAIGAGSRLTFTHEGLADEESAKSHKDGWSEAFDKLERALT